MRSEKKYVTKLLVATFIVLSLSSCFANQAAEVPPIKKIIKKEYLTVQENPIPGTQDETWVEPIIDRVKVPGQIDPAGNYYRLPHNTYYEIQPGRYQEVPK